MSIPYSAGMGSFPANFSNNGTHVSPVKDPRRMRATEPPSGLPNRPAQDPAQFFLDFTHQISDFTLDNAKKERLKLKAKQEDTIFQRATHRKRQFPSYLARARVFKRKQEDHLMNIDRQLETYKKRQTEFSRIFSQLVAKNGVDPQLKQDVEFSKANAALALKEAQAAQAKLGDFNMPAFMNSLQTAVDGLAQIKATEERVAKIETELIELKNLQSDLHSLLKNTRDTPEALSKHEEEFKKVHAEQNSSGNKIANIELALVKLESFWTKRLEEIESSFSAQRPPFDGRVADVEISNSTSFPGQQSLAEPGEKLRSPDFNIFKSDIHNLFTQLEKLRELQELKDQEIDKELQRLDKGRDIAEIRDELGVVRGLTNGTTVAINSLERRYNHLTTEPIVRDVVEQMRIMYPFASTAQREIEELKQQYKLFNNNLHALTRQAQNADILVHSLKQEQDSEKSERLNMIKDMSAERDRLNDIIKNALGRIDGVQNNINAAQSTIEEDQAKVAELQTKIEEARNKMEEVQNVTAVQIAQTMFETENAIKDIRAVEEKVAKVSETLNSMNHSHNVTTSERATNNNKSKEDMPTRGSSSASGPPPPLSTRNTMSSLGSPREPRSDREEFRIRRAPGSPTLSVPTGPSSNRARPTRGGGDLQRRTSYQSRAPSDSSYGHIDAYRPNNKRRRFGSDDSDIN